MSSSAELSSFLVGGIRLAAGQKYLVATVRHPRPYTIHLEASPAGSSVFPVFFLDGKAERWLSRQRQGLPSGTFAANTFRVLVPDSAGSVEVCVRNTGADQVFSFKVTVHEALMWGDMPRYQVREFETQEAAIDWMLEEVGDEGVDNIRFAYASNTRAVCHYWKCQAEGCCGFFDEVIRVCGRIAYIGCNYGH